MNITINPRKTLTAPSLIEEARSTGRGNKIWLELIKCFFIFLFIEIAVFLPIVILLGEEQWYTGSADAVYLRDLYIRILSIGVCLIYCRFIERRSLRTVGFIKPKFASHYIRGFIVGFGMMSASLIIGIICGVFHFEGFSSTFSFPVFLLYLVGFMIQGMEEEVIFRGYMMVSMSRKNSLITAIIGNGILFAFAHCFNPGMSILPVINLFLFSVFASLYMLRTNNIWSIGAMHSAWNFTQGCIYGFSVSGTDKINTIISFSSTGSELLNGGAFGPEGGLIDTSIFILGIICLMLYYEKDKNT